MKKIISIFAICVIFLLIFFLKQNPSATENPPDITPSPTSKEQVSKKQSITFDNNGVPIRVSWAITSPERVNLYSNLKTEQNSEEIKSQKNCKILVNGGFYSKTNTHLGLVISNFETISGAIQNSLFNGFLSISSQTAAIENSPPVSPRLTVQSGPLLMLEGKPLILAINNDQPNRRIAAATTSDNQLIFLAVYRDNSEFQGPLLADLPQIIDLFKKQTGINIVDAINLDGGSASAFLTDFESLHELAQIGSYFCVE